MNIIYFSVLFSVVLVIINFVYISVSLFDFFIRIPFISETPIILRNGDIKTISEIKVGDILEEGEKVYGIVKIDGSNCEQFTYKIGKNMIVGGPNLIIFDKNLNFLQLMQIRRYETL